MAAGRWIAAKLLLVAALILQGAGAFEISLLRGENITVRIKPAPSTNCVLRVGGKQQLSELKIDPGQRLNFTFDCRTPEKYWILVIEKNIDCMLGPCPFGDVPLQPFGLPPLNRTFIWDVKADKLVGLELKFSTWLRQILPGDTCSDQVHYNIGSRLDANRVNIGNFCRNGSVSRVKVQGGVTLTLQLPWNSKLDVSGFKLESRSSIQRLCIIESTFQSEVSTTLMSANYPLGLPEDELMTWQFVIPSNLRAHVFFRNYTKPNCERKYERLEYCLPGHEPKTLPLNAVQPVNIAGSFNLSLQGCDQDDRKPGALSLLFNVEVRYPENEENVTHIVDLTKEKNMNLTIYSKPTKPERLCLICIGRSNKCEPKVTLVSGVSYAITFLCQNTENIRIIAEQSGVCWNSRLCQMRPFSLVVPPSLTQLPILLETFTWKLRAPADTSIEIRSPTLKLKQHIPNQNQICSGSYNYAINGTAPEKALSLGLFCPGGAIEKIQMKDNVTITLKTYGKRWFTESPKQDLQYFFRPVIQEDCIFSLTPGPKAKFYLQTPNWLEGLPAFVSVYWNITVPAKQVAQLMFPKDRLGVTCEQGWANIYIKEQRSDAEETVRRHDQILPKTLNMQHHFWVNITNCKPSAKQLLSVQFMVTFHQKKTGLAVIIGVVVGGIAVLAAIGLVICCTKRKNRKKENQMPMVGVYNTNVNTQMPRKKGIFKKRRKTNVSHVYAVIDDTMVYGHLLDNSMKPENAEIGVYQPFSGPMSTTPPSPPPFRKESKVSDMDASLMLMTDNENYTFAHRTPEELQSNGDVNVSGNRNVGQSLPEKNEQENSVE